VGRTIVFEWLSVPARRVIVAANEVARTAGRDTIGTGDLVVGFLNAEGGVAATVLRHSADSEAMDVAARASAEGPPETPELLRMVLCAAVGVAAARGTRRIGSASLLLALTALEPPSLVMLCDAVGTGLAELSAGARSADECAEFDVSGDGDEWVATAEDRDQAGGWTDQLE
jgi:hypothetical protein